MRENNRQMESEDSGEVKSSVKSTEKSMQRVVYHTINMRPRQLAGKNK